MASLWSFKFAWGCLLLTTIVRFACPGLFLVPFQLWNTCLINNNDLATLISAKLSRQGWVAESSSFLNHSHHGVYPPSFAIDDTPTTDTYQAFLSNVGRFDWLMIEFHAVVRDIVTVEIVKRIYYLDRFKVSMLYKVVPKK